MNIKEKLQLALQSETPKNDLKQLIKELDEERIKRRAWSYAEQNLPEGRIMLVDLYEAYIAGSKLK